METQGKTAKKPGRRAGQSRSEFQCVAFLRRDALLRQLNALVEAGAIGHFWCVEHEADEETKKAHFHLRMLPPPSRAVDWQELAAGIVEHVKGEALPRRLVVGKGAVNDKSEDGLLYARHDRRYCAVKGLVKRRYDYARSEFFTDDADWLDGLWSAADEYQPERRRMTPEDILGLVEQTPDMRPLDLVRLCIVNGLAQGQLSMIERYRGMLLAERAPRLGGPCNHPKPKENNDDTDPE